jgi:hypothetical protein
VRLRHILTALPLATLAVALAAVCLRFHTAWPWGLAVHEDGRHTLRGTIFYFVHAAGELPVDWLLAATIAGAMARYGGKVRRNAAGGWWVGIAILLDVAVLAGAWMQAGGRELGEWLLQYHTRDGAPPVFGSHWGYHLLSEASLMLLAAALAAAVGSGDGRRVGLAAAWVAFGAATAVFGCGAAPFADARFLGHQVRETMTHALTTAPLGIAACLWLVQGEGFVRWRSRAVIVPVLGFVALAGYQVAGAVLGGVREHAQTNDPVRLVCVHFFEHTFSYAVVATHAAALWILMARRVCRQAAKGAAA